MEASHASGQLAAPAERSSELATRVRFPSPAPVPAPVNAQVSLGLPRVLTAHQIEPDGITLATFAIDSPRLVPCLDVPYQISDRPETPRLHRTAPPVASRCPRSTSFELHSAECSVDRGGEFGRRCCPLIGTNRPAQQQSSHVSPRQASRPSLTASTAMASAASGSAHHQPTLALRRRPPSRMAER